MKVFIIILLLILFFPGTFFSQKTKDKEMDIKVTSNAFKDGDLIPAKYSCDGENVSPHISWQTEVNGIKTFALICDDPDAPSGDWVHWVVYNIPGNVKELHEDTGVNLNLPDNATVGTNDFHKYGYGGPCPPSGIHRYYFKLYGLNTILHISVGATKKELLDAMKGHIIAEGQLMGKYSRKR